MTKKKNINDCLIELRARIEVMNQIHEHIQVIDSLMKQQIHMLSQELKDLEKRICPQCGLIHSPYSTKKH